jgi:Spy/CpxP family protein refolding chaperone
MRGRPNFDQMAKQLGLTEEQTPKFRSIMENQMQKMRQLRQDPDLANLSPDERRAKVKAIQDETTAQMKALLTPEQFDKWQKMPAMGMRGRRMGPPLGNPPPGGPPPGGPNAGSTNASAPPSAKPPQ